MVKLTSDHQYDEILEIFLAFNTEVKYEKLLDILLAKMIKLTNADAGTLYLLSDEKLHFHIVKNISLGINQSANDISAFPPIDINVSHIDNVSAYVAVQRQVVIVDDVYTDVRFNFSGTKHYDALIGYKTKSMLIIPLICHTDNIPELIGVIQLINTIDPKTGEISSFSNVMDEFLLMSIAGISANILANFLHIQEANNLFGSLVDVTTQAIAERSAYSQHHTQNVSMYCRAFTEYLNSRFNPGDKYYFTPSDIEELALAALLHDVGKMVTPLEVMDKADRLGSMIHDLRHRFVVKGYQLEVSLLKNQLTPQAYEAEKTEMDNALEFIESINNSAALSDEQWAKIDELRNMTYSLPNGEPISFFTKDEIDALSISRGTLTAKEHKIMQEHVMVTARLLDKIAFPKRYKNAPKLASNHHEFLNGTGYPRGISGDEVDIGARILTISDIFDALVSHDRPYKKSIPLHRSLVILSEMADEGKLDKDLVKLFIESKAWEGIADL